MHAHAPALPWPLAHTHTLSYTAAPRTLLPSTSMRAKEGVGGPAATLLYAPVALPVEMTSRSSCR